MNACIMWHTGLPLLAMFLTTVLKSVCELTLGKLSTESADSLLNEATDVHDRVLVVVNMVYAALVSNIP